MPSCNACVSGKCERSEHSIICTWRAAWSLFTLLFELRLFSSVRGHCIEDTCGSNSRMVPLGALQVQVETVGRAIALSSSVCRWSR